MKNITASKHLLVVYLQADMMHPDQVGQWKAYSLLYAELH